MNWGGGSTPPPRQFHPAHTTSPAWYTLPNNLCTEYLNEHNVVISETNFSASPWVFTDNQLTETNVATTTK